MTNDKTSFYLFNTIHLNLKTLFFKLYYVLEFSLQKILLVEDESSIADTVIYALETEGFKVKWHTLGQDALANLQQTDDYALIVLDVGLPDINGFDLCKEIRRFSDIPIIFLTARNEEIDRIVGLEIGADDYVTKPFSPRELSARIKVILKRVNHSSQPAPIQLSDTIFIVDQQRALISYLAQPLDLTRYEFLILKKLLQQPERVFTREQIISEVWTEPHASMDRAVDTHIKTLRQKLKQVNNDSAPIKTHRGLGYSIRGSVSES